MEPSPTSGAGETPVHDAPVDRQKPAEITTDAGYTIKVLTDQCPEKPQKSFERADMSQRAFCSRMAREIALCEAPFEGISCERVAWEEKRFAELESECMAQHLPQSEIPYWNESLFSCAYGDQFPKQYLNFPCRHRFSCWRSRGINWTSTPKATATR